MNEIKKYVEYTPHSYYERSGIEFLLRSSCEFNQFQIEILDMKRSLKLLQETYLYDEVFVNKLNELISKIESINPETNKKWDYKHKCSLYTIDEEVDEDSDDCFINVPLELSF